jgi:homoserine kinase type II
MLKPNERGFYPTINEKHCFEIGKNTALLHIGVKDFSESRANDLDVNGWQILFDKMQSKVETYQSGLTSEIQDYLKFLKQNWRNDLEEGAVHSDLFPDNVFFNDNDEVSGVIDFYFAANDSFVYDLAVIINAWAFDENNEFDQNKYNQIIKGYEETKKISAEERSFLKIALVGASLRFLLTRLFDKFNTPEGSLVKIKDPQEYLQKTRFFFSKI